MGNRAGSRVLVVERLLAEWSRLAHNKAMKKAAVSLTLLAAAALYVGGYVAFRQAKTEIWARDGRSYVIFPEGAGYFLYYLWRPLSYIDGRLTGTGAHIGPHRE